MQHPVCGSREDNRDESIIHNSLPLSSRGPKLCVCAGIHVSECLSEMKSMCVREGESKAECICVKERGERVCVNLFVEGA